MKNDISFLVSNSLNLYEHQSSLNPNMPIRGLHYFQMRMRGMVLADAVDQEIDFSIKEELVAMIRKMIARGRSLRSITDLLELEERM